MMMIAYGEKSCFFLRSLVVKKLNKQMFHISLLMDHGFFSSSPLTFDVVVFGLQKEDFGCRYE